MRRLVFRPIFTASEPYCLSPQFSRQFPLLGKMNNGSNGGEGSLHTSDLPIHCERVGADGSSPGFSSRSEGVYSEKEGQASLRTKCGWQQLNSSSVRHEMFPRSEIPKLRSDSVEVGSNANQPNSLSPSSPSYDAEFPTLASSFSSSSKRKGTNFNSGRARIELAPEGKAEEFSSQQGWESPDESLTCEQDEFSLPSRFGKKSTPPPNFRRQQFGQSRRKNVTGTNFNCGRVRIELEPEGKAEEFSSQQVWESPNESFTSEQDEFSLPSRFGKKSTRPPNFRRQQFGQSHRKNVMGMRKPDFSPKLHVVKPFDICEPEGGNGVVANASLDSNDVVEFGELENPIEGARRVLRSGMVLLKGYLSQSEQIEIVKKCRDLGLGPGGFYQPGYSDGGKLRLQMMCLGLDWDPQTRKYDKTRLFDGSESPDIPREFDLLVKRAIQDSHALIKEDDVEVSNVEDVLPAMTPDICIVNFYTTSGKLGLHQDRDESEESLHKGLPVVSFSIGDTADFLYGDRRNADRASNVLLESGDVLIFGGKSRHVFHGVPSIMPNSAPKFLQEETNLRPGRLNLTFRQY
ncbi:uncharacterized protein LOC131160357 [Malania oleifera]|uniref:uncharacterized protein LOC131160357 n=1 Tax=Malania oleifera TaxID=397392 RepID=UPI0025ADEB70|nr:uncharacterized protein LOC131160357 [Malania oleifera]